MDALSFDDTGDLIGLVLSRPTESARQEPHRALARLKFNEGQFYAGIIKHAPDMRLTPDQWFDLLSRLPNRVLRSDLDLPGILSDEHLKRLPPVTG